MFNARFQVHLLGLLYVVRLILYRDLGKYHSKQNRENCNIDLESRDFISNSLFIFINFKSITNFVFLRADSMETQIYITQWNPDITIFDKTIFLI